MSEKLLSFEKAVDHLLLGVPNLAEGMAWIEEKTGIKAPLGGRHPGLGTHNALLSLGPQQYLEIIAPDPTQTTLAPQFAFVQLAITPRLLTWAAATNDIHAVAAQAQAAGFAINGPNPGSRTRTDGQTLHWQTLFITHDLSLQIPFFIAWDRAARHPAQDAPKGCTLQSFTLTHPAPERLRTALMQLGLAPNVRRGLTARLQATIRSPRGTIELLSG